MTPEKIKHKILRVGIEEAKRKDSQHLAEIRELWKDKLWLPEDSKVFFPSGNLNCGWPNFNDVYKAIGPLITASIIYFNRDGYEDGLLGQDMYRKAMTRGAGAANYLRENYQVTSPSDDCFSFGLTSGKTKTIIHSCFDPYLVILNSRAREQLLGETGSILIVRYIPKEPGGESGIDSYSIFDNSFDGKVFHHRFLQFKDYQIDNREQSSQVFFPVKEKAGVDRAFLIPLFAE